MIRGGFVSATSVRWDPQEWEWRKAKRHETEDEVLVFTKQELLESSYVTIPADPGALVLPTAVSPSTEAYSGPSPPPRSWPVRRVLPVWSSSQTRWSAPTRNSKELRDGRRRNHNGRPHGSRR